jgi:PAS domain S-box-containing protein
MLDASALFPDSTQLSNSPLSPIELTALLRELTDLVLVLDRDGHYIKVIAHPADLYSLATECLGKTMHEVMPAEDADQLLRPIQTALESQTVVQLEYCLPINQQLRWYTARIIPTSDQQVLWLARNITDLKRVQDEHQTIEAALQQSENRFEKLTNNVPGAIYQFRLNPDGTSTFSYMSPRCRDFLGINPEEVVGDEFSITKSIHPEDADSFAQTVAHSAQTLQQWDWEGRVVLPSGQVRWIRGTSRPELQPDGSIIWDGLLIDINDRKAAELALQQSKLELERRVAERTQELQQKMMALQASEAKVQKSDARFQKLTANLPGMIYQFKLSTNGTMTCPYVSSGCRELFEVEPVEFRDNFSLRLIHPDDQDACQASILTSAHTLEPWRWEGRAFTASGKLKWIQGISRPERQPNGDIVWDGVMVDISDRKAAEAALRLSEERLRLVTSCAPIVLYAVDREGRFTFSDGKGLETLGALLHD